MVPTRTLNLVLQWYQQAHSTWYCSGTNRHSHSTWYCSGNNTHSHSTWYRSGTNTHSHSTWYRSGTNTHNQLGTAVVPTRTHTQLGTAVVPTRAEPNLVTRATPLKYPSCSRSHSKHKQGKLALPALKAAFLSFFTSVIISLIAKHHLHYSESLPIVTANKMSRTSPLDDSTVQIRSLSVTFRMVHRCQITTCYNSIIT